MASLNKIQVIGNLGTDPTMKYMPSGNANTSFRVATNRRYNSNGESKEETEWFTVITWGKMAETCNQYLSKGNLVYVEGRLHLRSWEGNDGQTHYANEITANTVEFLDTKVKDVANGEAGVTPDDDENK